MQHDMDISQAPTRLGAPFPLLGDLSRQKPIPKNGYNFL